MGEMNNDINSSSVAQSTARDAKSSGEGSAFTPGPWSAHSIQPHRIVDGGVEIDRDAPPRYWAIWRRFMHLGLRHSRPVAEVHVVASERAAAEANAHLIAAAPELLDVAEDFTIYLVEEDTRVYLRVGGLTIATADQDSELGMALLRLEAKQRIALAKALPSQPQDQQVPQPIREEP